MVPDGDGARIVFRNAVRRVGTVPFDIILRRIGLMFERSKILAVIDGDLYPGIDGADDLPIAGDDADTGPADRSPHAACGVVVGNGLIGQFHIRRHTSRHRHTEDAAFHEPRPFSRFVDRVLDGNLVLAVQGFGDRAGKGYKGAQAVITEICAVGRIDADRDRSPP